MSAKNLNIFFFSNVIWNHQKNNPLFVFFVVLLFYQQSWNEIYHFCCQGRWIAKDLPQHQTHQKIRRNLHDKIEGKKERLVSKLLPYRLSLMFLILGVLELNTISFWYILCRKQPFSCDINCQSCFWTHLNMTKMTR